MSDLSINKREREDNDSASNTVKKQKVVANNTPVTTGVVVIEHNGQKSFASQCYSSYPLRLIQQQSWLSCVFISMLGFGGGMVAGDEVTMKVDVREKGVVCFKTQGTTKIFKSPEGVETLQRFEANVEAGGLLAFTPDPTSCNESAVFCQQQSFNIAAGGSLVLVDWFTSGRNCSTDYWKATSIRNEIAIKYNHKLLFIENQDIASTSFGTLSTKLGHSAVTGMIVLVGPKTSTLRQSLTCFQQRQTFREKRLELSLAQQTPGGGAMAAAVLKVEDMPLVSVSTLSAEACVVRFLLPDCQSAYELVMEMLRPLASELGGVIPYADRVHRAPLTTTSNTTSNTTSSTPSLPAGLIHPIDLLKSSRNAAATATTVSL